MLLSPQDIHSGPRTTTGGMVGIKHRLEVCPFFYALVYWVCSPGEHHCVRECVACMYCFSCMSDALVTQVRLSVGLVGVLRCSGISGISGGKAIRYQTEKEQEPPGAASSAGNSVSAVRLGCSHYSARLPPPHLLLPPLHSQETPLEASEAPRSQPPRLLARPQSMAGDL